MSAIGAAPAAALDALLLHHEVAQFLYREARLADAHAYDAWEALWTDDGVYWVPANGPGGDPEREMSIIFDNRSRIALRIRQLKSGKRFAQEPRSGLCRTLSNIEAVPDSTGDIEATAAVTLFESSMRGDLVWASRTRYRLRRLDGQLKMARKTVILPNNDRALYSMSFLI